MARTGGITVAATDDGGATLEGEGEGDADENGLAGRMEPGAGVLTELMGSGVRSVGASAPPRPPGAVAAGGVESGRATGPVLGADMDPGAGVESGPTRGGTEGASIFGFGGTCAASWGFGVMRSCVANTVPSSFVRR